jgi:hypothetical protein
MFTVTARLPHVIRYINPGHPGGGMARRPTITIVSGEDLTGEQYADRGNGVRDVQTIDHPDGGSCPRSDGLTTAGILTGR